MEKFMKAPLSNWSSKHMLLLWCLCRKPSTLYKHYWWSRERTD